MVKTPAMMPAYDPSIIPLKRVWTLADMALHEGRLGRLGTCLRRCLDLPRRIPRTSAQSGGNEV